MSSTGTQADGFVSTLARSRGARLLAVPSATGEGARAVLSDPASGVIVRLPWEAGLSRRSPGRSGTGRGAGEPERPFPAEPPGGLCRSMSFRARQRREPGGEKPSFAPWGRTSRTQQWARRPPRARDPRGGSARKSLRGGRRPHAPLRGRPAVCSGRLCLLSSRSHGHPVGRSPHRGQAEGHDSGRSLPLPPAGNLQRRNKRGSRRRDTNVRINAKCAPAPPAGQKRRGPPNAGAGGGGRGLETAQSPGRRAKCVQRFRGARDTPLCALGSWESRLGRRWPHGAWGLWKQPVVKVTVPEEEAVPQAEREELTGSRAQGPLAICGGCCPQSRRSRLSPGAGAPQVRPRAESPHGPGRRPDQRVLSRGWWLHHGCRGPWSLSLWLLAARGGAGGGPQSRGRFSVEADAARVPKEKLPPFLDPGRA